MVFGIHFIVTRVTKPNTAYIKIFDFNYTNMSEKYAYTILGEVLDEVQGLESAPRKGAPELLLEGRRYEYRYLVVRKTYKVMVK